MSEYMFGVRNEKLPEAEVARRESVAQEIAGENAHYVQIKDPGFGWRGWFVVPNYGAPFDQRVKDLILRALAS